MRRSLLLLTGMLLLAACGGEEPWQTRDISGRMPPLQLHLSGTGGEPLTEAELKGRVTLLFFGYASCPDICPTTLARLAAVKRALPDSAAERVQVVLVSVDPERDSPEQLRRHTGIFHPAFLGVTGSEAELRGLTQRYRTTFSYGPKDAQGFYEVSHSSGVFVFDATGEARLLFRADDSVQAMTADLVRLTK